MVMHMFSENQIQAEKNIHLVSERFILYFSMLRSGLLLSKESKQI